MSCNKTVPNRQIIDGVLFLRHCEYFAVSACGKVVGKLGRVLRPKSNGHYRQVSYLSSLGVRHKYVHRMVAEVFVPNPHNLPCVNHKDGDKEHNGANNLEWVTHAANTAHAIATGLHYNSPGKGECGFRTAACKAAAKHDAVSRGPHAQRTRRTLPAVQATN